MADLSSGKGAPDIEIAYSPLAAPRNDGANPDANSFGITVVRCSFLCAMGNFDVDLSFTGRFNAEASK